METGLLNREVALYKRLVSKGIRIIFITYGSRKDLEYKRKLRGIKIVCNRWNLSYSRYTQYLSAIVTILLNKNTILKSNQIKGADVALHVAKRYGLPFIARCGYLLSEFTEKKDGVDSEQFHDACRLEKQVFNEADRIVVTTPYMKEKIRQNYSINAKKIHVIPNYVDTDLFSPNAQIKRVSNRICFIGRLEPQKNLFSLFDACHQLDVELMIIGSGFQESELRKHSEQLGLHVQFLGNLPNDRLPEYINSSVLFILPSHYEGHPKVLLEAMSCGVPVIGTDITGIREVLSHRETGFLCGSDSADMHKAIKEVIGDIDLRKQMSINARQEILDKYALNKIVDLELNLIKELI